MMFFQLYNSQNHPLLSGLKTLTSFVAICSSLPAGAFAQDTLLLRSFPGKIIFNAPASVKPAPKTDDIHFPYLKNAVYTADTAAINARYLPSLNPQLTWRYTYPITKEQMEEREKRYREENDFKGQIANEFVRSIFSRKKLKAVKPTL
jgi:hypothetical protein